MIRNSNCEEGSSRLHYTRTVPLLLDYLQATVLVYRMKLSKANRELCTGVVGCVRPD